ncbi:MAG: hypothetical protein ABF311_00050 [Polaribacter sp.]
MKIKIAALLCAFFTSSVIAQLSNDQVVPLIKNFFNPFYLFKAQFY